MENGHFGLHRRALMALGQLPDIEQARVMQRLELPLTFRQRVARES